MTASVSLHDLHRGSIISASSGAGQSLPCVSKSHAGSTFALSSGGLAILLNPESQENAHLSIIPPYPTSRSALLANTLELSSVCTPGSCRYLFSGSLTSQGVASRLHRHQSRCPHPISRGFVPSVRGPTLLRVNLLCSSATLWLHPGAHPLATEDENVFTGCQRHNSQPTSLPLNYYLPHISQPPDTCLYTPTHCLPPVVHCLYEC